MSNGHCPCYKEAFQMSEQEDMFDDEDEGDLLAAADMGVQVVEEEARGVGSATEATPIEDLPG